ncbi:MAG: RdgB/HAM1 family non-canonical purine NTP pyrophosphatase [Coriobacteriia bacterium]
MSAGEPATRVVVATANRGKLIEIRSTLAVAGLEFVTAEELGAEALEVEETGDTFERNALLKAHAYAERFGMPALADDSGLEVDGLGGEPGVRSSRYAGEDATDADNNEKLLRALAHTPADSRSARFRSVAALAWPDGRSLVTSGSCEGSIGFAPAGTGGFGYDPLFLPVATQGRTMAELELSEKNAISHRGAALRALRELLVSESSG